MDCDPTVYLHPGTFLWKNNWLLPGASLGDLQIYSILGESEKYVFVITNSYCVTNVLSVSLLSLLIPSPKGPIRFSSRPLPNLALKFPIITVKSSFGGNLKMSVVGAYA